MAALSGYPDKGTIVRGDPLAIPVNLAVNGVPIDATLSDWRAQVRPNANGALIVEFVCTPSGGQVLLSMVGDDTAKLKSGYVFDLEELDKTTGDTIKTWWICTGLKIQDDVSRDDPGPLQAARPAPTVESTRQDMLRKARGA